MTTYTFPQGFLWGAAASGIQTEGTKNKIHDSIWDTWHRDNPERFFKEIGPAKVCETYDRYQEDVQLMKQVGFNSFRTSIQWSRLIKDLETGEPCQDAVAFYTAYFEEMIANGITPMVNLYHFDMPAVLQEQYGGFESKHVIGLFVKYAETAFKSFGHLIKHWITFNEPIVPVEGGYLYDFHYPCKKDGKLAVQVGFNITVAHAKAVLAFREMACEGHIGTVLNLTPSYTRDDREEDKQAAHYADLLFNRSFLDPMVLNYYPEELCQILKHHDLMPEVAAEEMAAIESAKVDFLGVNYYVPRRVKAREAEYDLSYFTPEYYFENYINPTGRFNPYRDNNEILPTAIYDIAQNIKDNYGNLPWFLAEIGIAMDEASEGEAQEDGVIDDSFRTSLMKEHLVQLHRAIDDGANCFGVHQWTFIDNWSWTNSFKRRYGFFRLDLETGQRIPKRHGQWFKSLAQSNSFTAD
ncbi:glycoside hydrolase family 1 protein [Photobacterium rosenbergii]|uniref:glycoside hydrolase family 1 protein n=1 Tax=Photobacterium rosenbergii TaxID=294936 RepID=UPI001C993B95|nr:glycoside hydrolase family 1 protein [Photobacterium rosenbergii]MBY5944701.1 glycoside hydrolase family 1 protein [Photobacterium rosenbergii]